MISKTTAWHRLVAVALALSTGLSGPLYPGQVDTLYGGQAVQDSVQAKLAGAYVPGPELSPSTERLFFEGMLPGESRTLFMDLANLGEGVINLDSLTFPTEMVQVTLPLQTLHPGQFVRFPVTYTQTDLDTHDLNLAVHWASPRYGIAEALILTLSATPGPPLEAAPARVQWPQSYAGLESTARLLLENSGTLPATFPSPPVVPPEVRLSPLPQIMPGETSVALTVSWVPAAASLLSSGISIPYRVEKADGVVIIGLEGEALQPAYFVADTLTFGAAFAGSSYRRRVAVGNGSGQAVVLSRRQTGVREEEMPGEERGEIPASWIKTPTELEVSPGDTTYLEVVFLPRYAGSYLLEIPFRQRLKDDQGPGPGRLPDMALTITAEVDLPLAASTGHVDFGPQPVLETTMRYLEVVNRGAVPVSISMELVEGREAFSIPPLVFSLAPGDELDIPIYFRPANMQRYQDVVLLRYTTFGEPQEIMVTLDGHGLDRPLLRLDTIPDITLEEDFPGWFPVADLTGIFSDANHQVSYRLSHPFGQNVKLVLEQDGRLMAAITPDYHGLGEVVVQAVNELGHVVTDTFRLAITSVNDLPRLAASIPDLVLQEDSAPFVVGRLSEIFVDPDRALDTVLTHYTIYSPTDDDVIHLGKRGNELVLTVSPDGHGSRSFVVSARDAGDTSVVVFDAFKVTVLPVNDPPTVDSLPRLDLTEDETLRVNWHPYIHDVDHSYEELALRFATVNDRPLPLNFVSAGGLATIVRPKAAWFGKLVVRLTVTDAAGGTANRDFAVIVHPENDPPGPFKAIGPLSLEWDQRLRYAGRDTLVTFEWEPSPNLDPGDHLLYTWQLMDTSGQRVLKELPAGSATSVTAHLDTAGIFLWAVVVRDSEGAMAASDTLPLMLEYVDRAAPSGEGELLFSFGPNYPNPFSDHTRIAYTIPRYTSNVVITIYDAMGRKVRVLRSEPHYRGSYVAVWDGHDSLGQRVASGPYVAEIRAGGSTAYLKLVVVH